MKTLPAILGGLVVLVLLLALGIGTGARRRRRSGGVGHLGWALLFLTSGRMPPPPPETQIEEEANTEKDRSAADLLRRPADRR